MGGSIIDIQRQLMLEAIRNAARGEWKVLIVDEQSRKLIDNVVREDDILEERVMNIEQIEARRNPNPETDAVYILTPKPHIVDCLMADVSKRRYRRLFVLWTSTLPPNLRDRLDRSREAQEQIAVLRDLNLDFYPREARLVTLRDPYSFPILFHPSCSSLVQKHISDIAQKIMSVCVALGEYPTIRFWRPPNPLPTHEANVLCTLIADAVQQEIDTYAQWNRDFAPSENRPRGALFIVDRSIDLFAPLLHTFTYQAMAHDLLPIQEGDFVTFQTIINEGRPNEERKDMEISDKDKVWVHYRHLHMTDTIEQIKGDFQKFLDDNPHFAKQSNTTNLNDIQNMLAGMPQFQEQKEAYTLHLNMVGDCMNRFEQHKLPDLAVLEQTLATGLDENFRKTKNVADQVVRMLDEDAIIPPDRLRLIALYALFKYGLINPDIRKLLLHAQLPIPDESKLYNLELLGARVSKQLKDSKTPPPPLFPHKLASARTQEETHIDGRYVPVLKTMLEDHIHGTLDPAIFPYVKPELAPSPNEVNLSTASLRSAKPTWAKGKLSSIEPRQRIIVFVAGGATYSEARACYDVAEHTSRDVMLVTSHMLTPRLFLQQVGDLSIDRQRLALPADRPAKRAPAHLFEDEQTSKPGGPSGLPSSQGQKVGGPRPSSGRPPVDRMAAMNLNGEDGRSSGPINLNGPGSLSDSGKLRKERYDDKKKKHHFFSSKK